MIDLDKGLSNFMRHRDASVFLWLLARTGTKPIVFVVFIVLLGLPLLATTLSSPEWTKIKLRFIGEYVPKRITFRDNRRVQKRLVGIVESQHFKGTLNLR